MYIQNSELYADDARIGVMYDKDDTSYYVNPNATSILNAVRADIYYDRSDTSFYMRPRSTSIFNDVRANIFYDKTNTGYYMQPRATSSFNVVYAHAYYYHSDERLKKNIEPLEPDLVNRLYDLKGVEFDWKESGDHDIGLIAQEVKKVFPELVAENAEGTMGVKYGNLVALLLEAAKEQKKTIDELSQTVGTQTEFINNLKAALPPMMLMSTEERKAYQAQQAALAASQQPAQPQPEPVPPAPPVEAAPISETGPSLVALPPVNLDDVPLADDIKICPSVEAPACLSKEKLSHAEEFSCRTDTTSYMYSARIAYLCVRADKNAEATLRQQFADAMEKSDTKRV